MLELKNIKKIYKIGEVETKALDDVSVAFRKKEFVAILGTSGSGKTTCLNIIGGLDRYDSGDLVIKGKMTKDFKDKDWDAYRNNSIGFVFQSYNLITHLSIVANVELGMTISGVSKSEKHRRALEVLEQVGLKEHLHKNPNQLSGGQMQRVAIARALANNPEILLCDEPTGALDTTTSMQIMDLIKEVAKDKLVIMVTHNPEIAKKYADRIVEFKDGKIISDTHPHIEKPKKGDFQLKKTSMSFLTALSISFNNIKTKKGRTFLTAFASSIGIIGIALILSLSTGFKIQIDDYQKKALSNMPITISQIAMNIDEETMEESRTGMRDRMTDKKQNVDTEEVHLYDPLESNMIHKNIFTADYMDYIENIDPNICSNVGYVRTVGMNLVGKTEDAYIPVSIGMDTSSQASMGMNNMQNSGMYSYPKQLDKNNISYLEENYEVVAGNYPENETDLILVIDSKNRVNFSVFKNLGFDVKNDDRLKFEDIIGREIKLVSNDDYYSKTQMGNYIPNTDYEKMYNSKNSTTLKLVGIVRLKEDVSFGVLANGVVYSDSLMEKVIENALNSEIVKEQTKVDYNVMTMSKIDEDTKKTFITYLGGDETPIMILLYPITFEAKDLLLDYLNEYNIDKSKEDTIVFTDLASSISSMTGGIMDAITIVLIAFAAISLVVSLIMICIITYTSVLERTKEIGILKALGARKKDITRVFDAETCLLGVFSGVLGVVISWLGTFPINNIIYNMTELKNVARLKLSFAVALVIISTILTILGGHIPARMASKKDAVEALRSE